MFFQSSVRSSMSTRPAGTPARSDRDLLLPRFIDVDDGGARRGVFVDPDASDMHALLTIERRRPGTSLAAAQLMVATMRCRGCTTPQPIPAEIKTAHTVFVAVLVPAYWRQYGPGNFLWFSDVALLTSVPALWLESRLLASTQAVGVLALESLWVADFGAGVFAGTSPIGLASYMFDRRLPRFVRALSLFHFWLAPVLLVIIYHAGYDRRAFKYQSLIGSLVLLASWQLTKAEDNVNWVHSWPERIRTRAGRAAFVALMMAAIPLVVYLPTHVLLKRLFHRPAR